MKVDIEKHIAENIVNELEALKFPESGPLNFGMQSLNSGIDLSIVRIRQLYRLEPKVGEQVANKGEGL